MIRPWFDDFIVAKARGEVYTENRPITPWSDLNNKQPPFVEVTEDGMFTGHTCSIN
jgi:hypothetical protein